MALTDPDPHPDHLLLDVSRGRAARAGSSSSLIPPSRAGARPSTTGCACARTAPTASRCGRNSIRMHNSRSSPPWPHPHFHPAPTLTSSGPIASQAKTPQGCHVGKRLEEKHMLTGSVLSYWAHIQKVTLSPSHPHFHQYPLLLAHIQELTQILTHLPRFATLALPPARKPAQRRAISAPLLRWRRRHQSTTTALPPRSPIAFRRPPCLLRWSAHATPTAARRSPT